MIKEFKLNNKEYEAACEFEKEHNHPEISKGAIGGHISIRFTMTSIGNGKFIRCGICGEEKDITDYNW